jgi:hypothetical protein
VNNTCFGLNHKHECTVLTVGACAGNTCPFIKTEGEFKTSQDKANGRLARLDKIQQLEIADKYYGGAMPWLEGGTSHDC